MNYKKISSKALDLLIFSKISLYLLMKLCMNFQILRMFLLRLLDLILMFFNQKYFPRNFSKTHFLVRLLFSYFLKFLVVNDQKLILNFKN